jgi:hypothetical protein
MYDEFADPFAQETGDDEVLDTDEVDEEDLEDEEEEEEDFGLEPPDR